MQLEISLEEARLRFVVTGVTSYAVAKLVRHRSRGAAQILAVHVTQNVKWPYSDMGPKWQEKCTFVVNDVGASQLRFELFSVDCPGAPPNLVGHCEIPAASLIGCQVAERWLQLVSAQRAELRVSLKIQQELQPTAQPEHQPEHQPQHQPQHQHQPEHQPEHQPQHQPQNPAPPNAPTQSSSSFEEKLVCGRQLFEGAQGTIHEFAGFHPPSPAFEGADLCIKVMASNSITPDDPDSRLVSAGQLVDDAELQAMHLAACEVSELTHVGLVPYLIVELSQSKRCLKLLMPLYQADLSQWLARRRFVSEQSLLHIVHQLASALAYLHERGVLHLDLSLRNVLVDSLASDEPNCVIIDMETATLAGREPSASFTFEFSAPERPHAPSTKCDVFSLGMVVYCVGSRPDTPGIVDEVPDLGNVTMNHQLLTPARIAAVVHRDLKHCDCIVSLVTMMLNHDPRTRPSMAYVLQNMVALLEKRQDIPLRFPFVCGPFELHALAPSDLQCVELHHNSLMYDAHLDCCKCGQRRSMSRRVRYDCLGGDLHLPGHTSPFQVDVVLPNCSAIPQASQALTREVQEGHIGTYFLYPMFCDPSITSTRRSSTLQLHGGFAFFSNSFAEGTTPLSVRVLTSRGVSVIHSGPAADLLFFTAAQPWPSVCTKPLAQMGRIHREVPSMLGEARSFCWILPGESFELENGEFWNPALHGGFVFWFGDDPMVPNELDRYFAVAAPAERKTPRVPFGTGTIGKIVGAIGALITAPHASAPAPTVNISIFGTVISGLLSLDCDTARPPTWFRMLMTGEHLTLSPLMYLSPIKKPNFIPREACYLAFAKLSPTTASATSPSTPPAPAEAYFPQHGFALLDARFCICAMLPLHVVANAPGAAPQLPLLNQFFPIPLVSCPTSQQYGGSLEPAELREFFCLPYAHASPSAARAASPWESIAAGGVAYIGWNHDNCCFYLSDESKSSWLVRQWPL